MTIWEKCWLCGQPLAGTDYSAHEPRHYSCAAVRAATIGEVSAALREQADDLFSGVVGTGAADYVERTFGAATTTRPVESIALDALAGPSEAMEAAGLTNRGSLAWAMKERGFPQPVKVLRGIRLWSLDEVTAWKDAQS